MSVALKQYENFQALTKGTNVNDVTLLATDYLNHFNEALMLAELVADMPDMLDEFLLWQPRHYKDHFRLSGIADKDLAVQAYDWSPMVYRDPFETVVGKLNRQLLILQKNLSAAMEGDAEPLSADLIQKKCGLIRTLIDVAGGIINGNLDSSNQEGVDKVFTKAGAEHENRQTSAPARIALSKRSEPTPGPGVTEADENKARAILPDSNADGEPALNQSDIDSLFD